MAVKDSVELNPDERYPLGDYSFRIERSAGTSPNYDKIEAICTKGGKNARKSIQVPSSTKISSWYVEANETEATVYVVVEDAGKVTKTFSENGCTVTVSNAPADIEGHYWTGSWGGSYYKELILISAYPLTGMSISGGDQGDAGFSGSVYYNNRVFGGIPAPIAPVFPTTPTHNDSNIAEALWQGGGGDVEEYKTLLVGRFAIDLGDAGGDGPGSDWEDPGDYDPDWEEGDPTHTLYVEVTGALSGRHNDPLVDPSYSYIPADKDTVKDYGCGGDGGHGGGGGAGASTVVIHKFATNQANSKEVTALARRHGYGSGGGKGGKGGDGCILVYYGNGASPGPGPEPVIQPIVASLSVNKVSAAIGEDITWVLSATGGNGNYQYSFTLLDSNNQQVHSTGWQSGLSFSQSLQTEGTYHVAGYVRDSRETDTAQAPQSGTVQVSGSEPTPTPTPTGNAESQYNIYEISWTATVTSGEGPEPTPTPEGNVQSQYNISELNWSSTATGGEEPGPEPTPTPQADVLSNYEISDLSWTVEVADTTPSPSPESEPAPTPDEDVISQFDMSGLSWNVTFN